jgi:HPt (histidine-containing phosphotransfer) domain-containing protein
MIPHEDESHEQVLDRLVFEELIATLGNDTARLRNVYRKFLDSTLARLTELRHQSVIDSAATFHALKGSASMVGANRLAALAAKYQDTAPGLDDETKVSAIGELQSELDLFRSAIGPLLEPHSSPRNDSEPV